MTWAPDLMDQYRVAAGYVDQILKGAKAGDLPIRYPARYYLTLNNITARNLGLTFPPAVLSKADRVLPMSGPNPLDQASLVAQHWPLGFAGVGITVHVERDGRLARHFGVHRFDAASGQLVPTGAVLVHQPQQYVRAFPVRTRPRSSSCSSQGALKMGAISVIARSGCQ